MLLALSGYTAVYLWRWTAVRRRLGARGASSWRLAAFAAGVGLVFVALVSPVDRLGEEMFTFHAVQHILLMDLAPILVILGLTRMILRPLTARTQGVERRAAALTHPAFAVVLYAGTLWMWHVPALYELSLRQSEVHVVQHLQLAIAGGVFWWHLFGPIRNRRRLGGIWVLYYLAAAKLMTGALAAMLTFSRDAWYPLFTEMPRYFGWGVLRDQHFGGAVMMLEESIVMTIAFVIVFVRLLAESERDQQRRERFELEQAWALGREVE